jgi:hypothetical protein
MNRKQAHTHLFTHTHVHAFTCTQEKSLTQYWLIGKRLLEEVSTEPWDGGVGVRVWRARKNVGTFKRAIT